MRKLILTITLVLARSGWARTWADIVMPTLLNPGDPNGIAYLLRTDPFLSGSTGTSPPSLEDNASTFPATGVRTQAPTKSPTLPPTQPRTTFPTTIQPTKAPTTSPTSQPTSRPTPRPTSQPSQPPDLYPPNPEPADPMPWYFNYNISDKAKYGPGVMGLVQTGETFSVAIRNNMWDDLTNPPDFYWNEFTDSGWGPWKGALESRDVHRNRCSSGRVQSPIDLRENTKCIEHHQIRSLAGDYRVTSGHLKKQILGNKLRLLYPRRPCTNMRNSTCTAVQPPRADFPNGWSNFADVVHIDIKIPGEHRIWGEVFDGEMQIFSIHPPRRRLPTHSVLIRAQVDGYNEYFQEAILAFQNEYDRNRAKCGHRDRQTRQLVASIDRLLGGGRRNEHVDLDTWAEISTYFDDPDKDRELSVADVRSWDPRHPSLIPSIHFYRYDGSLTEPPCGEWITWFVCDKPMIISFQQLEQLKRILFTHVDANCHKTSLHYNQSVARPIRPMDGRPVWRCTEDDFGPDPPRPP